MPRRHQPPSLRKASIENIVCHFEDYCCAWSTRDPLEQSEQSDVFTPFQYLCDDMIQEINDTLHKRKLFRPDHYKLLLHSNIRRLNLRAWGWLNDQNDVIKTLGTRCQKLTHLNLKGLDYVKLQLMCRLMRNLPQIVCLKNIKADADVIKVICESCPNLLELHLNCFSSVQDTDLLYLSNYPDNPKTRPKLKKLSISGVKPISLDTIAHLLNNQTSLQCLDADPIHHIRLDHVFDQMYGEEFRSIKKVPSERIHKLLDITFNGSWDKNFNLGEADRLDLTFQSCPFLTKLTLLHLREGESLNNVAKLKHLKTLRVEMSSQCNFSKYMTPLFSEIGDNLTDLCCSDFDEINLILIGKLCPNLESLDLRYVSMISKQHPIDSDVTQSFPYFTNLTVIRIICLFDDDHPLPTENALSLLLKNASNIVHCDFRDVKNLTDTVISEANRKHGFRHLKTCHFQSCSSVSVESLWLLLCSDNPLQRLKAFYCKYVTSQDINLLQNEAKLRQFNIDIG